MALNSVAALCESVGVMNGWTKRRVGGEKRNRLDGEMQEQSVCVCVEQTSVISL